MSMTRYQIIAALQDYVHAYYNDNLYDIPNLASEAIKMLKKDGELLQEQQNSEEKTPKSNLSVEEKRDIIRKHCKKFSSCLYCPVYQHCIDCCPMTCYQVCSEEALNERLAIINNEKGVTNNV